MMRRWMWSFEKLRQVNRSMVEIKKFLVLHGPNLDRLGDRYPTVYGKETLASIDERLRSELDAARFFVECRQSSEAADLANWIRRAAESGYEGIVLNAAAFTHFEESIRDAVVAAKIPVVEVHLSNVYSREEFRHQSVIAPVAVGQIAGFGWRSYAMALRYLAETHRSAQEEAAP